MRKYEFKVQRGTSHSRDAELSSYTVDLHDKANVLDGLEQIRSEQEPDLLYRHSCHHGSCGTCGMMINGERKLACLTLVSELEGPIELRPLEPFPVIRDLAVDPAPLYEDFPREASYIRPSELVKDRDVPEEIEGYTRFENCIECGLCVSACPVTVSFMGPAALAAWNRLREKDSSREQEVLKAVDVKRGVWSCDRAFACSKTCPLGVAPAKHIAQLQRAIKASQTQEGMTRGNE